MEEEVHGNYGFGATASVDQSLSEDEAVKRILVVDDEASIRDMLRAVLTHQGYEVTTATDGADALVKLTEGCPDVILLDLMMPRLDGWKFLEVLRPHCTALGYAVPRVIVVSAHLRMNPQELLALGASALVTKPFNLSELSTLLRHLPEPVSA